MKNLKKVLALVLAFAMAFTMMATAGAAYTDQADIQATEAVDMLNTLGIMTGDPDGSFRPNDTITRAEACRMIYSIRTNSDNADNYADMQTTFLDVPADAWYAGYVKHCQAAGIVSGTSATTFEPNRDVTGVELALMCLRVMGYDPAKADIGGSTWSTKTIGYATEAGLLDSVNTTITSACPRQWAAQLMYNMIQAPTVQWSTDRNAYTQYFDDGEKRPTVGQEYLKLYTIVGTLTNVDDQNLDVSQTDSDYQDTDKEVRGITSFTNLKQDYTDLLGQKVKVMIYDKKSNSVLGVYPLEDNTSYTVNMKDIEKDGDKVKFDGKSYGFDDTALRVEVLDVDGKITTENVKSDYFDVEANNSANATKLETVTFVDNDGDGKLNIAFITKYEAAEVTYVGSDRITATKTYKMEDHNIADDLAKDDYAMISWNRFDSCKDIVKAEVLSDTLSSSKDKVAKVYSQYRIGDTWYNIDVSDDATSGWDNVTVGDTVKAFVVAGVIVDIDTDDGTGAIPTNIAVVVGQGNNQLTSDQVRLRFFDGTLKTVTLDKTVTSAGQPATPVNGHAYKVSGSDDNTRLEELKSQKYNGYENQMADYSKTVAVDPANGKLSTIAGTPVDDNAVIILWQADSTSSSSKKITGKQFKAISSADTKLEDLTTAGTAAFTKKVNGAERILMAAVRVQDTDITGTSYDAYGYVTSDSYKVSNGDVEFTMWDGSENRTVKVENGETSDYVKGTLVAYSSIDSDGYLQDEVSFGTVEKLNSYATDAKLYVDGNRADAAGKVTNKNSEVMNVTSDTHVLVVDSDADNADEIGIPYSLSDKLATAAKISENSYRQNMVYRVENGDPSGNDADLDLLVIDNTGAFYFDKPESGNAGSGNEGSISKGDFTFTTTDKTVLEVKTADITGDGNVIFTVNVLGNATAANTTFDWEVFVNDIPVEKDNDVAANKQNYHTTGVQVKDGAKVTIALSDIKVAGMSSPSTDDINNAFEQEGVTNVTVSGDVTGAVKVPEGKKLTLDDKAVLKDATVEGSVVVGDIDVSGDVDLSKADVTSIKNVDVQSGASLNVTADSIKDLTAGTLNVAAGGALKIADSATASSETLIGAKDARIQTAEDTTVSLDLANGAMTIAGDAEIPAGQTWYSMLGPVAAEAKGLAMELTSGTLTVNGTLKLVSAGSSSFKVSGTAAVVVGANGVINVAAKANLDGGNAITGAAATSQLNVTNGTGSISNVAGVMSHAAGNYTWDTESAQWTTGA